MKSHIFVMFADIYEAGENDLEELATASVPVCTQQVVSFIRENGSRGGRAGELLVAVDPDGITEHPWDSSRFSIRDAWRKTEPALQAPTIVGSYITSTLLDEDGHSGNATHDTICRVVIPCHGCHCCRMSRVDILSALQDFCPVKYAD